MREHYHEELDVVVGKLVSMTEIVASMMERATAALLGAELVQAESVIATDDDVDNLNREIETLATDIIALQQPVAGDLRTCIACLRMANTVERAGDLARHVAKTARMRYPEKAVPTELEPVFREMGQVATAMMTEVGSILAARDVSRVEALELADDRMDDLHRQLFRALLAEDWPHGIEAAVDVTLLSRFYERFADHCVSMARRTVYLVTGHRVDEEG
jgi:phosphate transport system protein